MPTGFNYDLHVFSSPEFSGIVDDAIRFFARTPTHNLPPPNRFIGSGVYGLYYVGDYTPYARIANSDLIYVGKAVPPGWRTARTRESETPDLYSRLREHTRSIQQATNLQSKDIRCRFMILGGVESDLLVPVEA